jgi:hypothetical protein
MLLVSPSRIYTVASVVTHLATLVAAHAPPISTQHGAHHEAACQVTLHEETLLKTSMQVSRIIQQFSKQLKASCRD